MRSSNLSSKPQTGWGCMQVYARIVAGSFTCPDHVDPHAQVHCKAIIRNEAVCYICLLCLSRIDNMCAAAPCSLALPPDTCPTHQPNESMSASSSARSEPAR